MVLGFLLSGTYIINIQILISIANTHRNRWITIFQ